MEVVRLLLEGGVEVDPRDRLSRTPLLDASLAGQTKCVIALLQNGAKADASDVYMKNCLHFAVENKHLATLSALLCDERVLCNLNRPDLRERVPLHYAAKARNIQVRESHLEQSPTKLRECVFSHFVSVNVVVVVIRCAKKFFFCCCRFFHRPL